MQSYKNDELLKTQTGSMKELADKMVKDTVATHHVIGHLPNRGDSITLNGLSYK